MINQDYVGENIISIINVNQKHLAEGPYHKETLQSISEMRAG